MTDDTITPPQKKRINILALIPVFIAVTLGGLFFWGLFNSSNQLQSTLIGKPVPEFDLPPIEGRSDGLVSTELVGEVSLVNVWASWCVPCRIENPLMVELASTGLVPIYGINYKDDPKEALAFLDELGDPFTRIGADRPGRISIEWGVYGLPETFVVDAEGNIAYKHIGGFNRRILEETILPVVRELQAKAGTK